MGKAVLVVGGVLLLVWCGLLLWALGRPTPEQAHVRAQAEATRLAIDNEQEQVELQVKQGAASARIAAQQTFFLGLAIAGVLFVLGLALVVPLWMYNRASMAYPRHGLYPIVVRPGLRGMSIYDANRLPGPDVMITSQAQAVQLAAALSDGKGMTAHERSAAMQGIGKVFQPQPRPAGLLDPPITRSELTASHVERLLLEDGRQDDGLD